MSLHQERELKELIARVEATDSSHLDEPVRMYLREIAGVPRLDCDAEGALLGSLRQDDQQARLEGNLWTVAQLALPFVGRAVKFLDLVQVRNLGLARAVDNAKAFSKIPSPALRKR